MIRLSGTPAEAGVREDLVFFTRPTQSLSGTPAEAGVRGLPFPPRGLFTIVSVEPPPKQGCEGRVL